LNLLQHGIQSLLDILKSKELYRTKDDVGLIVVSQRGSNRFMSFGSSFEQSSLKMNKPHYLVHEYTQAMLLVLCFVDVRRITLLGLGGGGLVHCITHYFPDMKLNVVELRQAVIDVAYTWFDLPRMSQLKVHRCDAWEYLIESEADNTDIIFSDLYDAKGMSDWQSQIDFIDQCYKALSENGWLVINYHVMPAKDSLLMSHISELFPSIFQCDLIQGNHLLYCGKSSRPISEAYLAKQAGSLAKYVKMPLFNYYRQLVRLKPEYTERDRS